MCRKMVLSTVIFLAMMAVATADMMSWDDNPDIEEEISHVHHLVRWLGETLELSCSDHDASLESVIKWYIDGKLVQNHGKQMLSRKDKEKMQMEYKIKFDNLTLEMDNVSVTCTYAQYRLMEDDQGTWNNWTMEHVLNVLTWDEESLDNRPNVVKKMMKEKIEEFKNILALNPEMRVDGIANTSCPVLQKTGVHTFKHSEYYTTEIGCATVIWILLSLVAGLSVTTVCTMCRLRRISNQRMYNALQTVHEVRHV